MEFASRIRWILVIAVTVILLILVSWGLFTIASNIFRGDGDVPLTTQSNDVKIVQSTSVAKYRVEGPIVANEDHRSYSITVSSSVVTMKTFKSYGRVILEERSYQNTQAAYDSFLSALLNQNVTELNRRNTSTDFTFEDQGVCANGQKFFVELDSKIFRWSTSCSDSQGNAGFDMAFISALFEEQVPDFADLTYDLNIY
jgi:type II secretory pathway component PulC